MFNTEARPRIAAALTLLLAGLTGACAHVGQDEFETQIESLRGQIEEGDQASQQQIDQLSQRTDERLNEVTGRLDNLSEALSELQGEFDVTVDRLESAVRFNTPIHFAFDKAEVRSEDQPLLDRFSSVVTQYYPNALITVEGFTDSTGPAEYNKQLGLRRAEAVRQYLLQSGFAKPQVRTVSYGEDANRMVAPGEAGPGQVGWENRRVAFVIEHLEGQSPTMTSTSTSTSAGIR